MNKARPNRRLTLSFTDYALLAYSACIFLLVVLAYVLALCGKTPHNPDDMALNVILGKPLQDGFILGTDYLGRDILSRLIYGVEAYFLPGMLAVSIATGFGALLGALAIISRKRIRQLINFTNRFLQIIPRLVLLLLLIAIFEPGIFLIMTVIGIVNIPSVATLVSARVEILRDKRFVDFARSCGAPLHAIIFKHLLWYNCRSLLISLSAIIMAEAILLETSLSYLGFGTQEPTPSWGNMVQAGANYLLQGDIWSSTIPALAIMLVLSALYLFSHTIVRILDGK